MRNYKFWTQIVWEFSSNFNINETHEVAQKAGLELRKSYPLENSLLSQSQSSGGREGRGFPMKGFSGPWLDITSIHISLADLSPMGEPNCRYGWGTGSSCVPRHRKGRFWLPHSGFCQYFQGYWFCLAVPSKPSLFSLMSVIADKIFQRRFLLSWKIFLD